MRLAQLNSETLNCNSCDRQSMYVSTLLGYHQEDALDSNLRSLQTRVAWLATVTRKRQLASTSRSNLCDEWSRVKRKKEEIRKERSFDFVVAMALTDKSVTIAFAMLIMILLGHMHIQFHGDIKSK